MKRSKFLSAIMIGATALTMSSCGALWTSTSVGVDSGYYGAGIYNDWYSSYPGAPLAPPIYWGNQIYPGPPAPPAQRPTAAWRPSGNTRPSAGVNNPAPSPTPSAPSNPNPPSTRPAYQPSQGSGNNIVPSRPININGSNPGPVIQPR
ncbi:MAG: hypothetical protein K2H74_00405 [Paramuribaculum sp.]|nr:hypothetical protein [Paramuribaculum sp.]